MDCITYTDDTAYTDDTGYDQYSNNTMSFDSDGDGYADTTMIDTDGDQYADVMIYEEAGYSEAVIDTDGDGYFDTLVADTDGNGVIDVHIVDQDGDGIAEYEAYGEDPNGSFVDNGFDVLDASDDVTDTAVFDADITTITDDPVELSDSIHGEPMAEITYHQAQPGPVDCLPTSVAMVLTEVTGELVPADDVVALANEMDMMTSTGMAAEDGVRLLEEYGIEAELTSGTLDGLRDQLDSGTGVIIGLDSADLYSNGGGPFDEGMEAGHAVVITGIDDEAGLVYINDPGFPDGAGVAISIETFEDAWADSDNLMIEIVGSGDSTEGMGIIERLLIPINFVLDR
ncbi:MAG: C39 family peptidase [Acidimicrobiales bacterium]